MINIVSLKSKTKKIREFNKKEWESVHPEHFGRKQDRSYWDKKKFFFVAEENGEILGTLDGDYIAGVMYISQLIVGQEKRGLGIGRNLMAAAEDLAKKNRLHLIYLKTGVDWKAVSFYESLGYGKETRLNNFYEKKDFWVMVKEI